MEGQASATHAYPSDDERRLRRNRIPTLLFLVGLAVAVYVAIRLFVPDTTVTRGEAIDALRTVPYEIRYRQVPGNTLSAVATDDDGTELAFQVRFGQDS